MRSRGPAALIAVAPLLLPSAAFAAFTFGDNFDAGPSSLWSNLRGNWSGQSGVYNAAAPSNSPPTHTSLPFHFADVEINVSVNSASDGGIWLRTDDQVNNGVLLVTGGGGWGSGNRDQQAGNTLYFHTVHNGSFSGIMIRVFNAFPADSNIRLRITAIGPTYTVYLNDSPNPVTSLTTPDSPTGRVGLYDFSTTQTFDNFAVTSSTLPGDANLNGLLDADDVALTDRGRTAGLTGWSNGDFNFDNAVTDADLFILHAALSAQPTAPRLPSLAPEPSTLAITLLLLLPVRHRRT